MSVTKRPDPHRIVKRIEFDITARAFGWETVPRRQRIQVELNYPRDPAEQVIGGVRVEDWTVRVYDPTAGLFTWRHKLTQDVINACVARARGEESNG